MKPRLILSVLLFAAASAGAYAADTENATAAATKAEPSAKAAKPHSHVQDKSGVPQDVPTAAPAKKNAAKDTSKHYHPRDMK